MGCVENQEKGKIQYNFMISPGSENLDIHRFAKYHKVKHFRIRNNVSESKLQEIVIFGKWLTIVCCEKYDDTIPIHDKTP